MTMSDDIVIMLRGLPLVTLEYMPSADEIIIVSAALAAKGLVAKPITGRGHPGAIGGAKLSGIRHTGRKLSAN
jgi:hypothetical protein